MGGKVGLFALCELELDEDDDDEGEAFAVILAASRLWILLMLPLCPAEGGAAM